MRKCLNKDMKGERISLDEGGPGERVFWESEDHSQESKYKLLTSNEQGVWEKKWTREGERSGGGRGGGFVLAEETT